MLVACSFRRPRTALKLPARNGYLKLMSRGYPGTSLGRAPDLGSTTSSTSGASDIDEWFNAHFASLFDFPPLVSTE